MLLRVGAERKDARHRWCPIGVDKDSHSPEELVVVVNSRELIRARAAIAEEVVDQFWVKVTSACAWCRVCVESWLASVREKSLDLKI